MFATLISLRDERQLGRKDALALEEALPASYKRMEISLDSTKAICYSIEISQAGERVSIIDESSIRFCIMLGDMLVTDARSNAWEAEVLREAQEGEFGILRRARGVFGFVSIFESRGEIRVTIGSDKLGVRPLYYWSDGTLLIIATTLRVMERLSLIRKFCDKRGIAETIAFGYPLSKRTQYLDIYRIGAGEVVTFGADDVSTFQYWRWDSIGTNRQDMEERTREAYRLFTESVRIRQAGTKTALAFLSGGMDSRAIVGALRADGIPVTTLNFSPSGSQDQILAAEIASRLHCNHIQVSHDGGNLATFRPELAKLYSTMIKDGRVEGNEGKIWSGDGGSVALGTVHLDETIVRHMRQGDVVGATRRYRLENSIGLPLRSMTAAEQSWHREHLLGCILEEIAELEHEDPAQSLFIFLMLNDQRRHLDDMYEEEDEHRLDYHLPFFDSNLLECVFALPIEYRLYHRYYSDWFNLFDETIRSVPWQTYPGHVVCPLPIESTLSYQWDKSRPSTSRQDRLEVSKRGFRQALGAQSVKPMSRLTLAVLSILHAVGRGNYEYVFDACEKFRLYRDVCSVSPSNHDGVA